MYILDVCRDTHANCGATPVGPMWTTIALLCVVTAVSVRDVKKRRI